MSNFYAIAAAAVISLSAATAQAATLWNNLPGTDTSHATIQPSGQNVGMGFSVPAGTNYTLDSLTLNLSDTLGDTPLVRLFSDSGTNPSTPLVTFTNPLFGTDAQMDFTFVPSVATILMASTSYWIVVQSSAGNYKWHRDNPSNVPTGVFSYIGTRFNGNPPTTPANNRQYGISIDGSVESIVPVPPTVPLPATVVLLLGGVAALGLRSRKRA